MSFDGYLARDVGLSFSKTGMKSKVPIKNVLVNGFSGNCTTAGSTRWPPTTANFDNPTVVNGKLLTGFGGTSLAAPRWAGFLALVNEQSAANGRGTVGFINPALYNLGTTANRSAVFHDVTSGSNPPTVGDGSGFNAVPGYDLVTAWGSPAGAALIDLLAGRNAK